MTAAWIIVPVLWSIAIASVPYGIWGLRSKKVKTMSRGKSFNKNFAKVFSLSLILMGVILILSLVIISDECGFFLSRC